MVLVLLHVQAQPSLLDNLQHVLLHKQNLMLLHYSRCVCVWGGGVGWVGGSGACVYGVSVGWLVMCVLYERKDIAHVYI